MYVLKLAALVACISSPIVAQPLPAMEGTWRGSGWAKQTPDGPQETVRCQITNTYDSNTITLSLKGRCAVPGRKLTVAGKLTGAQNSERITGRWFNPDGIGSVPITGAARVDSVAFTFRARDPDTGRSLAQNVEWRVTADTLTLRSSDRAKGTMMSDIAFTK